MTKSFRVAIALLLSASACSSSGAGTRSDEFGTGTGSGSGTGGTNNIGTGDPGGAGTFTTTTTTTGTGSTGASGSTGVSADGDLTIVIRDFKLYNAGDTTTDPDFENTPKTDQNGNPNSGYLGPWDDHEIVAADLGMDGKPVYKNATGTSLTTHGKVAFDKWFRDVSGTNIHVDYPLKLTQDTNGAYVYDSNVSGVPLSASDSTKMFFPIDDGTMYQTMFGNQGLPHNYSFTVELHTTFVYHGGEFFNFRGDDDVFVFINKKLVINLGGIHGPEPANVMIDSLGLTKENEYPLDFFYAERHVTGSNLLVTTSLGLKPAMVN
jgi:fibro-slime domain-containing protein